MTPPIENLVRISVSTEASAYAAWVDRCVVNASAELLLLSIAAPATIVKGIRASIAKGGPHVRLTIDTSARFTDGRTAKTWDYNVRDYAEQPVERSYDLLNKHPEGYIGSIHRLAYGHAHAVFVAKQPGLLLNLGDRAIATALKNPAVCTTPFLPEWVPFLAERLRDTKLLKDLWGFQCRAAILRPGCTKQVDEIVLAGGRAGRITIPA